MAAPDSGAAGGSSVDPNIAAPVDCGTFDAANTDHLFRSPARSLVSSAAMPSSSPSPGTRPASTTTAQPASLQSAPSTVVCSRSARCLQACRRTHAPEAATRAARPSPRLEAAQRRPERSSRASSRLPCLPLSGARPCRKAAPRRPSLVLEAAQHLLRRSSLPYCCACPSAGRAERPPPAAPAEGPRSSDSTVPTLRRLRRRLAPARTVPVCLRCPTGRALLSGPPSPSPLRLTTRVVKRIYSD